MGRASPANRITGRHARIGVAAGDITACGCRFGEGQMETRFSFGGDEHVTGECSEEMSLEAFFKVLAITRALRESDIPGILDVTGGNASYMVRFDPDVIPPGEMMREIERVDRSVGSQPPVRDTRIIEVPVYYEDPWTHETLMRFRERHQDPGATDLEYAARINGFESVAGFLEAHHGAPWIVCQVGFVAGGTWLYQLVDRSRQLQVPKYVRPRTDTPKQTVGHGGAFACVYSMRGAGGYQMFGITPLPIYDPSGSLPHLRESMVFFRPGDLVKFEPITREEYDERVATVEAGTFAPRIRELRFDLRKLLADGDGYNQTLVDVLGGD